MAAVPGTKYARQGKFGFYVEGNLLYHSYKIAGQKVMQLCVPLVKRK